MMVILWVDVVGVAAVVVAAGGLEEREIRSMVIKQK